MCSRGASKTTSAFVVAARQESTLRWYAAARSALSPVALSCRSPHAPIPSEFFCGASLASMCHPELLGSFLFWAGWCLAADLALGWAMPDNLGMRRTPPSRLVRHDDYLAMVCKGSSLFRFGWLPVEVKQFPQKSSGASITDSCLSAMKDRGHQERQLSERLCVLC